MTPEQRQRLIDLIELFATARGDRLVFERARLLAFIDSLAVEPPPIASLKDVAALSFAAAEAKFGPAFGRFGEGPGQEPS